MLSVQTCGDLLTKIMNPAIRSLVHPYIHGLFCTDDDGANFHTTSGFYENQLKFAVRVSFYFHHQFLCGCSGFVNMKIFATGLLNALLWCIAANAVRH